MTRVVAPLLVTLAFSGAPAPQRPVSSPVASIASIDVSVSDGREPIGNLRAEDFELRDNGVLQHIDGVDRRTASLDVSLVLDVSGSVTGPLGDNLREGALGVRQDLSPDDRAEYITVDREIRRTMDLRTWMSEAPRRIGDGGTRLFDAVVTAVLEPEPPDRRRVIVVLTDGLDTGSLIDPATRLAVLGRSNAVVDLVAISIARRRSGPTVLIKRGATVEREEDGDYDYILREITDATGGVFRDVRPADPIAVLLRDDLDRLRQTYTLRYRPTGVTGPGWHTLAVRLTRSHHDIQARSGYFGK
jgi:hypothetical protein